MGAQAGGGGWEKGVSPCLRQCVPPDQARLAGSYSPFPEKKFWKKSYISYTHVQNLLYLLAISGVGLGVGFGVGCRIGVGFMCFFFLFLHFPLHFDVGRGRMIDLLFTHTTEIYADVVMEKKVDAVNMLNGIF